MLPVGRLGHMFWQNMTQQRQELQILTWNQQGNYIHTECNWHQMKEEAPKQPNDHLRSQS